MHRFVAPGGKRVGAVEVVAEPALRAHRLEVVGIPLGDAAGLGHERDQRGREIRDRRRRLHAIHVAGDLRARLALELCEQELDRALGAGLLGDVVPPEAASEITLVFGRPELPPRSERRGKRAETRERIAHPGHVHGRRDDVGRAGLAHARVVLVHGCDGRDPPLGRRRREARAGVAVPARAEGRPRDEDVGLDLGQHLEQGREGLVLVLGEVVVAAGERRHDLHALERRGQPSPGPDRAVEPGRRRLRPAPPRPCRRRTGSGSGRPSFRPRAQGQLPHLVGSTEVVPHAGSGPPRPRACRRGEGRRPARARASTLRRALRRSRSRRSSPPRAPSPSGWASSTGGRSPRRGRPSYGCRPARRRGT